MTVIKVVWLWRSPSTIQKHWRWWHKKKTKVLTAYHLFRLIVVHFVTAVFLFVPFSGDIWAIKIICTDESKNAIKIATWELLPFTGTRYFCEMMNARVISEWIHVLTKIAVIKYQKKNNADNRLGENQRESMYIHVKSLGRLFFN